MAIINNGEVLYKGRPVDAMAKLKGKVWKKKISKAELPDYKLKFNVVSERLLGGAPEIHVINEVRPDDSFEEIPVGLEDVYFAHINTLKTAEAEV